VEAAELLRMAKEAARAAYAPYSGFTVGAALLCADGRVYTGCNVENAALTPGICAERTAIYKAVSEGEREFAAIAVVGGGQGDPPGYCPPCGVCRQVMREFAAPETFRILLEKEGRPVEYRLADLLPESFGPETTARKE